MKGRISIGALVAIIVIAMLSISADDVRVRPLFTTDVEVLDNGNILLANKGYNELRMYDATMKELRKWSFAQPLTSVVASPSKIYATSSYTEGFLTAIDPATGDVIYKVPMGMGACGIVLSGDKLYVLNRYKATVNEVDAATGNVTRMVDVLREPCAAVMSKDGKYLFVNNFLPAQRADVDTVAADVSVIDLATFKKIKDIKLDNGSNALRDIALSPDGKFVIVSHNLGRFQVPTSQLQQGWMNTSAISLIDAKELNVYATILLDEPDRGAAGVWGIETEGDNLVVAHSGTHEMSIINYPAMVQKLADCQDRAALSYDLYFMRDIRHRLPIAGNGPRSIALKDGKLYAPTYFADTMNIIELPSLEAVSYAYNPNRVESREEIGERIFNDAMYCYQNWQSCNGCHPGEARTDAMNWDLMNDGIGNPKNCKSMLFSHVTPANMISGIRAEAEIAVRAGFKFIQFYDITEEMATCVDDYMRALRPLPSPYLQNGELSASAKAGKEIFYKLNCDQCHSGIYYTDMKMHRIGDDIEFEAGWDTPTLREVWRTAPYLFDGRAATMEEVFSVHKHGVKGNISQKEIKDLTEYVNSL